MKQLRFFRHYSLFISVFVFAHAKSLGQGTITFANRIASGPDISYDARVTLPDGAPAAGEAFTAGLFLVEQGGLTLLETTYFRSGIGAGYFLETPLVSVPRHPGLSPATFRVRVWESSAGSYENAVALSRFYGEFATGDPENDLFIPALGPEVIIGPISVPSLKGIQPLTLVPEPTVYALLIMGGAIWFATRRRIT